LCCRGWWLIFGCATANNILPLLTALTSTSLDTNRAAQVLCQQIQAT
jgi:hypothetical protein